MERIPVRNEVEARLLSSILDQDGIPHVLVSYHDTAYDGLFQLQKGWGHIEADLYDVAHIKRVLKEIREKKRIRDNPKL